MNFVRSVQNNYKVTGKLESNFETQTTRDAQRDETDQPHARRESHFVFIKLLGMKSLKDCQQILKALYSGKDPQFETLSCSHCQMLPIDPQECSRCQQPICNDCIKLN